MSGAAFLLHHADGGYPVIGATSDYAHRPEVWGSKVPMGQGRKFLSTLLDFIGRP
jgi:hypothetical protein